MGLQLKLVPWHLCHLWRWTLHHFWWEEIQLWWWLWIHPNRGVFKCSCDVNLQGSFRKESQWHQWVFFACSCTAHLKKKKHFGLQIPAVCRIPVDMGVLMEHSESSLRTSPVEPPEPRVPKPSRYFWGWGYMKWYIQYMTALLMAAPCSPEAWWTYCHLAE